MILDNLYGCNAQHPTNILIVERKPAVLIQR